MAEEQEGKEDIGVEDVVEQESEMKQKAPADQAEQLAEEDLGADQEHVEEPDVDPEADFGPPGDAVADHTSEEAPDREGAATEAIQASDQAADAQEVEEAPLLDDQDATRKTRVEREVDEAVTKSVEAPEKEEAVPSPAKRQEQVLEPELDKPKADPREPAHEPADPTPTRTKSSEEPADQTQKRRRSRRDAAPAAEPEPKPSEQDLRRQ